MPRFLVAFAFSFPAAATAQIPFDHLVYVHRAPSAVIAAMGIVDPVAGTVTTIVPQTGSWSQHGSRSVAIDPAVPATLYSLTSLSTSISLVVPVLTLTGNRFTRTTLPVNLGVGGIPAHVGWASGHGLVLLGRGGAVNRMFLRDMTSGVVTPQPTATLLPNLASDLLCIGSKAYAVSEGDGTAAAVGTIVEWDLVTNTDRVVGSGYPPLFSLAAFQTFLLAGDNSGTLHLIDPASGTIAPLTSTGLGRLSSIATNAAGNVFVVSETATSWAIHDALTPGPALHTTASPIDDLVFAPTAVATMLTFETGCPGSTGPAPALGFTGPPALGSTFAVTLTGALANAPAVLVFGTSRVADPLGPLPRDLTLIGMPGCTQYTDLAGTLATLANGSGAGQLPFTVPPNPVLAGAHAPVQWLCLDAAANPFGATTSGGGELFVY
jgi:hypothetical protein